MKTFLVAVVALACGLGLGYLLFARGDRPAGRTTTTKARRGKDGPTADGRGVPGVERGQRTTARVKVSSVEVLRQLRMRHGKLMRENRAIQTRLDGLLEDLKFARGTPTPWSQGLPGRLSRKPLVRALTAALRQAGWKGEITDVGCKEYPCVLAGSLRGEVGSKAFRKVLDTRAMAPYIRDHAQTSITTRSGHYPDGKPFVKSFFAVALLQYAQDGSPEHKRTIYRLRQLLDATTGQ